MKNRWTSAQLRLDWIGMGGAFLCAIHCAALPLVVMIGAIGILPWLANPWVEMGFILLGLPLAAWTLGEGYLYHHRQRLPIAMALLGFGLIFSAHAGSESTWVHLLSIPGGLLVAFAHFLNWRRLSQCSSGCAHTSRLRRWRLAVIASVAFGLGLLLLNVTRHPHEEVEEQRLLNLIWKPSPPEGIHLETLNR